MDGLLKGPGGHCPEAKKRHKKQPQREAKRPQRGIKVITERYKTSINELNEHKDRQKDYKRCSCQFKSGGLVSM